VSGEHDVGSQPGTPPLRREIQTPQPGSLAARRLLKESQAELGHAAAVHVLEQQSTELSRLASFHDRGGRPPRPEARSARPRPPGAPRRQFDTRLDSTAGLSGVHDPDEMLRLLKGPPGTADMFGDVRAKSSIAMQHARVLANMRAARGQFVSGQLFGPSVVPLILSSAPHL